MQIVAGVHFLRLIVSGLISGLAFEVLLKSHIYYPNILKPIEQVLLKVD